MVVTPPFFRPSLKRMGFVFELAEFVFALGTATAEIRKSSIACAYGICTITDTMYQGSLDRATKLEAYRTQVVYNKLHKKFQNREISWHRGKLKGVCARLSDSSHHENDVASALYTVHNHDPVIPRADLTSSALYLSTSLRSPIPKSLELKYVFNVR